MGEVIEERRKPGPKKGAPNAGRPKGAKPTAVVSLRCTPDEVAQLDRWRGKQSRSAYVKVHGLNAPDGARIADPVPTPAPATLQPGEVAEVLRSWARELGSLWDPGSSRYGLADTIEALARMQAARDTEES